MSDYKAGPIRAYKKHRLSAGRTQSDYSPFQRGLQPCSGLATRANLGWTEASWEGEPQWGSGHGAAAYPGQRHRQRTIVGRFWRC